MKGEACDMYEGGELCVALSTSSTHVHVLIGHEEVWGEELHTFTACVWSVCECARVHAISVCVCVCVQREVHYECGDRERERERQIKRRRRRREENKGHSHHVPHLLSSSDISHRYPRTGCYDRKPHQPTINHSN